MTDKEIAVIEGNTFLLSDSLGDVVVGTPHGLYHADTRFLSGYTLELNGQAPLLLSAANIAPTAASFYATNPAGPDLPQGSLAVIRDRIINDVLHDDITIVNHSNTRLDVTLTFTFAADFADVFEVRGGNIAKAGTVTIERVDGCDLAFCYRRAEFIRSTLVSFSQSAQVEDNRATLRFALGPKEEWRTCVSVRPAMDRRAIQTPNRSEHREVDDAEQPMRLTAGSAVARGDFDMDDDFIQRVPALFTDDARLRFAYDQAIRDLAGLRLAVEGGHQLPAAGLPWYMAIFGRDSIITAMQTMLLGPELAIGALRILAGYQSRRLDVFRDEEPGKIPHEIRFGELASLEEVPHSRYYGTADATPLFVVLLSEAYRWTGDLELVRSLLPNIEAALQWIDVYGDADGDGFVEYARKSLHGLLNQGWKDSPDCVCFVDGNLAVPPIALAEVQGYVYDAKVRAAELFDLLGDGQRAKALRSQADELKERFNEAFWMPEEGFFAIALDADKRRVDSLTSNPGHCLWSGIVDHAKAKPVVERLMSEEMFSGWGIRTMSSRMRAYNPLSYHNGSVWPHDNSLIAAGMLRYGFAAEANAVIDAMLDASAHFAHHRLPELFSGFPRRARGFPVEYLGANAPQAWAAGAVVLMLQTLLGAALCDGSVTCATLNGAPRIHLKNVPFRDQRLDLVSSSAVAA
ncbi:MAG: amylo-alpha-1,6-glucosidase [Chloroflexi bacterium]|nr:amylo-alpha-1,6-glucosidase [Chloroflexota bacterium]